MKKKLEADLISIAHRILQLKNKNDVNQLFLETQKLYEKLAVLRFVEDHFSDPKPTIGQAEVVEKMKEFFEHLTVPEFQKPISIDTKPVEETPENKLEIEATLEPIETDNATTVFEPVAEVEINTNETLEVANEALDSKTEEIQTLNSSDLIAEEEVPVAVVPETTEKTPIAEPTFDLDKIETEPIIENKEPVITEIPKKKEIIQISFDDLLGGSYADPEFVKVTPTNKKQDTEPVTTAPTFEYQNEVSVSPSSVSLEKEEPKSITLNDKLVKEITIGLNDRIAFVKHLFGGNNEDYNRVLSQLITFDTFLETKTFIEELVKPDYNNWEGKEDYEHRFMEIIEKKFLSF